MSEFFQNTELLGALLVVACVLGGLLLALALGLCVYLVGLRDGQAYERENSTKVDDVIRQMQQTHDAAVLAITAEVIDTRKVYDTSHVIERPSAIRQIRR